MKKVITGVLVGLVLVSLASAGLVGFLSNSVSGTVNVEGPVFYLDSNQVLAKTGSGFLRLNDDNVNGSWFSLTTKKFYSDNLNVESFYPLDFNASLNLKVFDLPKNATTNETLETCSINIVVYKVSNSGGSPQKLCDVIGIGLDNENDYSKYTFTCPGEDGNILNLNKNDRLELSLDEQCPAGSSINIKYGDDSKIEVIAQ